MAKPITQEELRKMLKLARRAVAAQKQITRKDVDKWAEHLAKDLCIAGEGEYKGSQIV